MRNTAVAAFITALCLTVIGSAQERVDFSVIEKIRAEGMERSKILDTFD